MGNANGTHKRAVLVEAASGMGGHTAERVHAAEALAKTVAPLKDLGARGLALPCPDLSHAQAGVLADILDAAADAVADSSVTLTVALADAAFQLRADWVAVDSSWQWAVVHHATPADAEDAHLVLAGILPQRALASAIPWGLVEGFAGLVEDAIVVTPVPSLLVPLILACTLQRGGTVTVECGSPPLGGAGQNGCPQ